MKPSALLPLHVARLSVVAILVLGLSAFIAAPAHATSTHNPRTADDAPAPVFYPITAQQGQVGKAFSYQVAAQNGPVSYAATGLPDGLTIDPATGLVSGLPTTAGTFDATVSATNTNGTTSAALTITIALPPGTVSLTADVNAYPAQGITGDFLLTRTGDISVPLAVNLLIQGSAKNGADYTLIKSTKKFKAGQASKHIRVVADDESGRGITKKAVKITVLPSGDYVLGASTRAKVKIFYTP